jgi:hypothetical protein
MNEMQPTTRSRRTETAWNRAHDVNARLTGLTEKEACWLCDFVYDHTDARATLVAEPYSHHERWTVTIHGARQADAERTLRSYRDGDEPVWTDWEDDWAHEDPEIWAAEHRE